ncbi:GvpL/GvpF family gas vesicle protein [Haloferax mediterranei ATCC 33500]|uniref:Gas vesicle protein F n=2 Tax=Haloferax mediterranei (strain ATCC 33500 / DSM 1411 / JCM 8866 / NBRC 14739 / NCIMB 2177 / R-4) TaxID=523841 RepID=GVPF_HALMT|nr:GvpL/GvpF family gas vesicle protein [Haloferax mediterranei]Q02231.1 RecName: Full=Gas vesicle protein F; Short=GvpF [Haloferax mediterranei ATCC 33500]AFK19405.1 gas-vesicle operon protein gvpF [Haloferax mediterranei ATCC 33500]AHZ21245.1 protein gvpF [Haloferax mediterranei ATCC 33500]EMA04406.1 gas-vesicle operon protein gvpF [Haloferax mediterranei ATCC 33500]MDX5989508.1 GvpL/GvpF family gas vesicle protein [Haloferax mediterranei ATCC 33500]QCQ75867.1 GvpL/GvpF family gas vesicle p
MSDNLYTYGVIEQEDIELEIDGVAGAERVYTVDYRTLSAVVSDIDTTDPERTDEDVQVHNTVLQHVLEYDGGRTVVPMSFGMAFKNGRTLKGVMRGARRALRSALNDIEGTVELGVKIITSSEGGVSHDAIRADIGDRLSELSINETENDLFSDRLVVNKSYLVARDRRDDFDAAIDTIEEEYGDELTVQYTGPWAPYNFVDIHIGADQQRGR